MQYILLLILGYASIKKKDSKIITNLLMLYMCIIFSFGYKNADYENYLFLYHNPQALWDYGFKVLCYVGNFIHLDFNCFRLVISFVCLNLIINTIKLYTENTACILYMYFLFPFFADVIQIRNFIIISILTYSIRYLIGEKKNMYKYFLCILFASTFHIIALIYLVLPLIIILNFKKADVFIVTFSTVILFIVMYLIMQNMNGRVQAYGKLNTGVLYAICFSAIILFNLYICTRCYNFSRVSVFTDNYKMTSYKLIFQISILFAATIVLIYINPNYHRIYRNLMLLFYILYLSGLEFSNRIKINKTILVCMMVSVPFLNFLYAMLTDGFAVLRYNFIFDKLNSFI